MNPIAFWTAMAGLALRSPECAPFLRVEAPAPPPVPKELTRHDRERLARAAARRARRAKS